MLIKLVSGGITEAQIREVMVKCDCGLLMLRPVWHKHRCLSRSSHHPNAVIQIDPQIHRLRDYTDNSSDAAPSDSDDTMPAVAVSDLVNNSSVDLAEISSSSSGGDETDISDGT